MAYPFGNLQWVTLADSPVKGLSDLKGKTISVGKASSTTQTFGKSFLEAHDIKLTDLKVTTPGFGGGFNQLRNGNVAAHLTLGKTPISALREMATFFNTSAIVANNMAALKGVKLSKVNVMTTGKDLT